MLDQKSDNKNKILLAAKKLFAEKGYEGTGVRQICDEAGVNISLVSYHFGGKKNLFDSLFHHFYRPLVTSELELISDSMSPSEGVRKIISLIVRITLRDPEMSNIIYQELSVNINHSSTVNECIDQLFTKMNGFLRVGKERGLFEIDSIPHSMLMVLSLAITHTNRHNSGVMMDHSNFMHENLVEQVNDFVLRGLGVRS